MPAVRPSGGGGGLTLGPTPNEFTAATRAAAVLLRDAESAAWLALYDAQPTFTITLNWPATPTNTIYQSRRSGSWADVTGLVRGKRGAASTVAGPMGTSGTNGTTGADGTDGTNGTNGVDGTNGIDGSVGPMGTAGTAGAAGAAGAAGTAGADGTNGTNGTNGSQGAAGPQGQFDIFVYRNGAAVPSPSPPVGGTYVITTGVLTSPTDTTTAAQTPTSGENIYRSTATINPGVQSGTVTPTWSAWVEQSSLSTGQTESQVSAQVQSALEAAVMGNTETGIAVTYNADGTIDFIIQGTPAQTHTNFVGITDGELSAVVSADFSVSGDTAALTIPAYQGSRRLLFARPASESDPSAVYLYLSGHRNTVNQLSTFTKSTSTIELSSVAHNWWGNVGLQSGAGGYILEQVT